MSETIQLKVEGMTCMHCVAAVRKTLAAVDGVKEVVDVSLEAGSATVRGNARSDELIAAVKQAGYTASI
jgi:copper chaperone CopZ